MEKDEELKLTQMRELVQELGYLTEGYGDETLKRFLIARSMDPKKASKMFVSWKKWRDSFVPLGFIPESQVTNHLEDKKLYLQGLSKDGYPLLILLASKHYPPKDVTQFKRFVVHMLDKGIASGFKGKEIGNEKIMAMIDMHQLSYKNTDPRGLIIGFQFLQAYYPERLAKLYIINMPWFFVSIWKMVSYFVEKATLEKVLIISNEEEKMQMMREVGEDVLPEEYGGRAKLVALQDVVLPPLDT